jgi:acyl carrier protein
MIPGNRVDGDTMTLAGALDWLAEMFEEPEGHLTADTARGAIPAWDSLGQLILMSALDQRFRIRLSPAELASLASVRDILDILAKHQRLHGR